MAPDHPRSRGEYGLNKTGHDVGSGSSPLSRGIPMRTARTSSRYGIIPALAGNTWCWRATAGSVRDHPRSRGEYPPRAGYPPGWNGSSPLSRGIRALPAPTGRAAGIIPALAGNTPSSRPVRPASRDHPRSRGEYISTSLAEDYRAGSSPLSRGILRPRLLYQIPRGIIPALAGNTRRSFGSIRRLPDHPRSRGEYFQNPGRTSTSSGSSPLSRGIRERCGARISR